MKVHVSKILNGPSIVDSLEGGQVGLDLSGVNYDLTSPGDIINFNLWIRVITTPDEDVQFDGVDNFGLYIDSPSVYTGDYDAETALEDILDLGDQGYGLAIKNPSTGVLERFKTGSYDTLNKRYVVYKEQVLWYNTEVPESPELIPATGGEGTVSGGTGAELELTGFTFYPFMVGCRLYNDSKSDWVVVEAVNSSSSVTVSKSVNWLGDSIYMKNLESPIDGVIGFAQAAEDYGNVIRLECQISLPVSYNLKGIKQFAIKFAWYKETE